MTNIAVPVLPSLQCYRVHLREFVAGMVFKLNKNAHKDTPTKQHIEDMIVLLRSELDEFEEQLVADKWDPNALVELFDISNYALLTFVALRNTGVPTHRELFIRKYLSIDPVEGKVYCRATRRGSQYKVGEEIRGTKRQGYVDIKLQSRSYQFTVAVPRSHLIWWQHHGIWPTGVVDHKNRIRNDDRINNLVDASFSDNAANHGKEHKWPRYVTQYTPSGRQHLPHYNKFVYQRYYLGMNIRCVYYDTPEEAARQGSIDWAKKVAAIATGDQR